MSKSQELLPPNFKAQLLLNWYIEPLHDTQNALKTF